MKDNKFLITFHGIVAGYCDSVRFLELGLAELSGIQCVLEGVHLDRNYFRYDPLNPLKIWNWWNSRQEIGLDLTFGAMRIIVYSSCGVDTPGRIEADASNFIHIDTLIVTTFERKANAPLSYWGRKVEYNKILIMFDDVAAGYCTSVRFLELDFSNFENFKCELGNVRLDRDHFHYDYLDNSSKTWDKWNGEKKAELRITIENMCITVSPCCVDVPGCVSISDTNFLHVEKLIVRAF
jgi:hypothetical protein